MANKIIHIYDKIAKRIFTLSSKAVINLINGLFETDYPEDSIITYNWTEFEDKDLKRTLADNIITINNRISYHMEIQTTIDEEIMFRVVEYGFGHAYKNRICERGHEVLPFPEPRIIYVSEDDLDKVPQEYSLELDFGSQGRFTYKVPVTVLQNMSAEELTKRKMIVLIPFFLLKLRKVLTQSRTEDNKKALKKLIEDDIVNSIKINVEMGNISAEDGRKLYDMVQKLYWHIYADYEELEDITMMIDESLNLPSDIYDAKIEKLENLVVEKDAVIEEKDTIIEEKDTIIGEKDTIIGKKDSIIGEQSSHINSLEAENEALRKQLAELTGQQ